MRYALLCSVMACAGGCVGHVFEQTGVVEAPVTDAGGPAQDSGSPAGGASRPPALADGGQPPPGDAGSRPDPRTPGSSLETFSYTEQHAASEPRWGDALTDIVRHLPRSYGDTYYDADFITYGHETTHGIHAHLRNHFNTTGARANAFYLMGDRAALVVEPAIRKSQVAQYVPSSLRGSRFSLYITGSSAWDDTPLYVWDEWVAYTNGGEVGVDRVRRGLWAEGWRDGVAGQLEFTVYALAVGMAVEAHDPGYFRDYAQFREMLAYNARRAMDLYREGAAYEPFRWDEQDAYYERIRTAADAAELRAFATRTFGERWGRDVLGLR